MNLFNGKSYYYVVMLFLCFLFLGYPPVTRRAQWQGGGIAPYLGRGNDAILAALRPILSERTSWKVRNPALW